MPADTTLEEAPLEAILQEVKRRFDKDVTLVCGLAQQRKDGSIDYSIICGNQKQHRRLVQLLRVAAAVDVDQLFRGKDVEEEEDED